VPHDTDDQRLDWVVTEAEAIAIARHHDVKDRTGSS
jgi:hypothetical protein